MGVQGPCETAAPDRQTHQAESGIHRGHGVFKFVCLARLVANQQIEASK